MKALVLILVFCLFAPFVFAGVEAEIIAKDLDDNGNIRIWTQYKIDGKEVESEYPKINGKYVYATRFAAHNFAGMTDSQIEDVVLYQAKKHSETLIRQEFIKKNVSTNSDIFDNHLPTLLGKKVTLDSMDIKIDDDKKIKVKTDGTQTISITP